MDVNGSLIANDKGGKRKKARRKIAETYCRQDKKAGVGSRRVSSHETAVEISQKSRPGKGI
jgi:hypothetical protein